MEITSPQLTPDVQITEAHTESAEPTIVPEEGATEQRGHYTWVRRGDKWKMMEPTGQGAGAPRQLMSELGVFDSRDYTVIMEAVERVVRNQNWERKDWQFVVRSERGKAETELSDTRVLGEGLLEQCDGDWLLLYLISRKWKRTVLPELRKGL